MCDQANAQIIQDIMYEWTAQKRMFTAWNVTQEGKVRGTTESHSHLKSAIHSMWNIMASMGYDRSLINTPTGDAWLYHPVGADISAYTDQFASTNDVGTVGASNVTSPANNQPDQDVNGDRIATVDSDGRLNIFGDLLQKAGLDSKQAAYVCGCGNRICIKERPGIVDASKVLFVNSDGRIRLGKLTLMNDCPSTNGQYKVRYDATENAVVVESIG
jgi:hypothetical protein